ncbi:hypothetical protein [Rhodopirellula baltica]|uniref:Uncharacterized protein n=1 Tax=Rhodopirellula baltica SWK14 TaxID=993516 RepID=L7CN96_RHOBT|nr:hypothetical protein [Rhodopirellula baltica]ELP35330.1 hypothetical protein RBSWK_00730 [Rhodopirellula baltica SWK14]
MSINNVANEKRVDIIDSHYGQNVRDNRVAAIDLPSSKTTPPRLRFIAWFAAFSHVHHSVDTR